jgi:hypothetical protein
MLPIAMTTPKLDALRSHNHVSKLYLSIYQPNVIFNGLVNSASAARGDRTITYDNSVSGSWSRIESGMTLWVGSASGTFDLGKVRVKSATSTTLTVAENEYINWQNNIYLTVVDYVDLVAIFPRLVQDTGDATVVNFYKDYDIAYTNQNSVLGAFPVMGSHRAAFLGDNGTVDLFWSASGTYPMVSGSAVRYNWTFGGATATGTAGQTPGTARYSGTGHYVTKLTVTVTGSSNANEVAYRYVSIYNKPNRGTNVPIRQWTLSDLTGSRQDGGFRGKVNVFETLNYKLEGGELVVIFSEDEFNGIPQSIDIGTVRPDDGILFVGYVLEGSVEYDYEKSKVAFDIGSASEVLKRTENFAISVESMANPSAWWHFYDMTTKKAMYHYIKWHSTLLKVADVFWLGKDYYVQFFDSERTNVWDAIQAFMKPTLIGGAVTNNKGQVVFQTEPESFTTPTLSYPKIMDMNDRDVMDNVDVSENLFDEVCYVEMGGIDYDGALNGNNSAPMLSAAPGIAPKYYGKNQSNQGLALESQQNLNEITGNILAKANSNVNSFRARMTGNYRFTLAPINMLGVHVPADKTLRNKMVSGTFYPDNINYNYEAEGGFLSSSLEFIPVVNGTPGVTLEIKPPSTLAPLTFPPLIFPGFSFGFGTNVRFVAMLTATRGLWFTDNFDSDYPIWYSSAINYVYYTDGKVGETPGADTARTLRTLDVTPSGLVVVCGTYGLYSGEMGSLSPFADTMQLIDDFGDYTLLKVHPQFWLCGVDDGGAVSAVGASPYSTHVGTGGGSFLYGGSIGGVTKGETIARPQTGGSATRGGGGWFITFGEDVASNQNRWTYSPDGFSIGDGGNALNARIALAQGCYHASFMGKKYFYVKRNGAPATAVMTLSDEFDNESDILDAGDTAEPFLYRSRLAVNPAGALLRSSGALRLSEDGGASWRSLSGTFSDVAGGTDYAVCSAKDAGAWIVAKNRLSVNCGVYYTADNGVTWLDKTGNLGTYFTNDLIVTDLRAFL